MLAFARGTSGNPTLRVRTSMNRIPSESFAGKLLIASTLLDDTLFERAVCLVVQDDEDGTIGLVLNRPLAPQSDQLLSMLTEGGRESEPAHPGATLHFGGPLSGPVVALHSAAVWAEAETAEGVYVAAQKDHLQKLLGSSDQAYRLLVGHAGWASGQLDSEVAGGQWHVMPASSQAVFAPDEAMWPGLIRHACGHSLARWVGARQIPLIPELN
jgi:putative transcriptional regulator